MHLFIRLWGFTNLTDISYVPDDNLSWKFHYFFDFAEDALIDADDDIVFVYASLRESVTSFLFVFFNFVFNENALQVVTDGVGIAVCHGST